MTSDATFDKLNALDGGLLPERTVLSAGLPHLLPQTTDTTCQAPVGHPYTADDVCADGSY